MAQLFSTLFFAAVLAGVGTLIVRMLRAEAGKILDALAMMPPRPAPRPWPSRVRLVGIARPAAVRSAARRATA
ncbi:hypothetical protein [Sphingomonas quercus]|uniref:Uncharacterized protein n=1 Tax=Sphingomonas quercus TaxID=2842451 RepID=A0ABS6BFM1_9SPHN|nr:hypothetical protein [Sphingomonas quercus]MBU3076281.1 hypothetical protein [Sphingomonas quercus]